MASLNEVKLIGHLGKDPETHHFPNGGSVTTISIATTEKWKDKQSGEMQEHTEWHRVKFFGRLSDIASEYLSKGALVYVSGRLRTDKYTDKENVERYATNIMADRLVMLGGKRDDSKPRESTGKPAAKAAGKPAGKAAAKPAQTEMDMGSEPAFADDDDIPF